MDKNLLDLSFLLMFICVWNLCQLLHILLKWALLKCIYEACCWPSATLKEAEELFINSVGKEDVSVQRT